MKVFKKLCFAKICFIFVLGSISGQSASLDRPVSELSQRQIRFQAMEQRAIELSEKLSKMSGTEPIELLTATSLWNLCL